VTVNDPGAYSRPWTSASTLQWVANQDIELFFCDDSNKPRITWLADGTGR